LPGALAIYDRVDYLKVTPESAMAAFGGEGYPRGFQQFEAIGFQRGADGRAHTADDLELGPVDATWSIEVFYEVDASRRDLVGTVSPTGFFTPAADSQNTNYDIWVIATAKNERNKNGEPLVGKGYVVVTVPTYMFNGRKYVRDLDRWIEDGSATR
jgi:quinohemoprotein amine dehydrogenase